MASSRARAKRPRGLMPVRFHCQMCGKGCRDAAAFASHERSEVHLRRMAEFRAAPDEHVKRFSDAFEAAFAAALARTGGRRVAANALYQEVIRERDHVRMSSTAWATLGDFVAYLGKTGKADVTRLEDGALYVQDAGRNAAEHRRKEADRLRARRRAEAEAAEADRIDREATAAAAAATAAAADAAAPAAAAKAPAPKRSASGALTFNVPVKRQRSEAPAVWVRAGIVVRVLDGPHAGAKGEVTRVSAAGDEVDLRTKRGRELLRQRPDALETVIPALGRAVLIVGGERDGQRAELLRLHEERFSASVRVAGDGAVVELPLERVCKVAPR